MKTEAQLIREIIRIRLDVKEVQRSSVKNSKRYSELGNALGWLDAAERYIASAEQST